MQASVPVPRRRFSCPELDYAKKQRAEKQSGHKEGGMVFGRDGHCAMAAGSEDGHQTEQGPSGGERWSADASFV